MDAVEVYNKLQNLISDYIRFNYLIELSIQNNNKIKSLALEINDIITLLEDEDYDIVEFKTMLDSLYNKTNIKLYSNNYICDIKNRVKEIDNQLSTFFNLINLASFEERKIDESDANVKRLETLYYNYCISKLREYLDNYNNNYPLKYDSLNVKLKSELEKEVFINSKSRVRQI